jgi:hypothetical protein
MLHIALKEWQAVCDLLLSGRLAFVLRKGGIIEDRGPGMFDLQHTRFALFPSWAHQKPDMLKAEFRAGVQVMDEPDEVVIHGIAEATAIWRVPNRAAVDALDDLHPWSPPQIDMRFNYKPDNPLYLVVLRAARLAEPLTIENLPAYGGCRSWVPLEPAHAIDDSHTICAMNDEAFGNIVSRIRETMRRD